MNQSEAWIMQAKSDLDAAKAVRKDSEFSTYCQALAKYQQVTEKSVKGMIAALSEAGFSQVSTVEIMPLNMKQTVWMRYEGRNRE
jgi:HEPN domain-containing protein